MGEFSCFAEFGNGFEFSTETPLGEKIYNAIVAMESKAFDLSEGTPEEARVFATAMGLARARYTLDRAQNQEDPDLVVELLPLKEQDWGVVPREDAGIVARQRALKAAMLLSKGGIRSAVEAGLRSILGDDFVALRALMKYEAASSETPSVFARPDLPYRVARHLSPVTTAILPASLTVYYELPDATNDAIVVGDVLLVNPENLGQREVVTVTGIGTASDGTKFYTATFTKSHDVGVYATTQNYCTWTSTQRSLLVVAKSASALDPEKRRLVNEFMAKAGRAVDQWAIVQPSSPGAKTTGPFALDTSPLGAVTIGTMSIDPPGPPEIGTNYGITVATIGPLVGPSAGGQLITVTGTGFNWFREGGFVGMFGAGPGTSLDVIDDNHMTFLTPAGGPGPDQIWIRVALGYTPVVFGYTYV